MNVLSSYQLKCDFQVCVGVCMCEREKERESAREREFERLSKREREGGCVSGDSVAV